MRSKFFKRTINRKEGAIVLIGQAKWNVRPFQGMGWRLENEYRDQLSTGFVFYETTIDFSGLASVTKKEQIQAGGKKCKEIFLKVKCAKEKRMAHGKGSKNNEGFVYCD